jgi:electron transport complex protein RnfB
MTDPPIQAMAGKIDALLPQTQCRRCGFEGCRPYAEALAGGETSINRCPPGGIPVMQALAGLLGTYPMPLDPSCGREGPPRVARIVEADCIGCAKCIDVCPTDAIAGARKWLHTVIAADCSGCELCLPACPVDCILMELAEGLPDRPLDGAGIAARAGHFRDLFERRNERLARNERRWREALAARLDGRPTAGADGR